MVHHSIGTMFIAFVTYVCLRQNRDILNREETLGIRRPELHKRIAGMSIFLGLVTLAYANESFLWPTTDESFQHMVYCGILIEFPLEFFIRINDLFGASQFSPSAVAVALFYAFLMTRWGVAFVWSILGFLFAHWFLSLLGIVIVWVAVSVMLTYNRNPNNQFSNN
jgi:hypothetical protein